MARADFVLLAVVILLAAFGALNIYSCTHTQLAERGQDAARQLKLQLAWIVLGILMMLLVMAIDYSKLGAVGPVLYGICMGLLIFVLLMPAVHGARRWIGLGPLHLQPAELVKLALILMLGMFLANREEEERDNFTMVVHSLLFVIGPAVLLMAQPDLGTPVVLGFIWLVVMYVFGARVVHLGAILLAVVVTFTVAWHTPILKEHQRERLISFLNPEQDPQDTGYHVRQSKIAIGSGHLWGSGPLQGRLSKLSFIPDQHTDFIFTVVGEEYGFVGSAGLIIAYLVLLWRGLLISIGAKDLLGRLLAAGVVGLLFIHVVWNLGMTMGMMPVKGLPLPFMSYGGSNMITSMMAVGLLQNIHMRRQKIDF